MNSFSERSASEFEQNSIDLWGCIFHAEWLGACRKVLISYNDLDMRIFSASVKSNFAT